MKRTLGLCLTGCLLLGGAGAAFAQAENPHAISNMNIAQDYSGNGLKYMMIVNGQPLQDRSIYTSGDELMIPLRPVAEALGYKVTWNNESQKIELSKAHGWFFLKIGEDQYNFAKMLIKLGKAPELKNGKTYVPLRFVEEVLKLNVVIDETGNITISESGEIANHIQETAGIVTEVNDGNHGNTLLYVMGKANTKNGYNSIALHVDEKTEIIDGLTSKILKPEDIKANAKVQAFYDSRLTKSLPPQGHAKRIVVLNQTGKVSGTIKEVRPSKDSIQVHIDGESDQNIANDVVLNITSETNVVSKDGKVLSPDQLKTGNEVIAYYGPVMTLSLPPMGKADTIIMNMN
ncbi:MULTISPECIES: copper amine oxidase N-terminal domain-containing protein [Aneurinibacillus]|uniref:Copper amine oxidase N-terminal domain-containing protein n=1 Tax=Aneurinibacillus thermoaerophilus TaxID=143495 RepID=A0ABX8YER2_ANETH|nr:MULTISPECIES: copper amine oxidase N-terminal domain-containing protein [Aneurinibacillus]AMA73423.1 hypothetical protein ACH33_11530 [Aneurinibacillus sp. XH2]MED0680609.1 copper amine oxidase N-terminal domain-containing protein [Aneurinibacillus thermoaerophilus]MED0738923.1 copper amine oxidase N-terminal domain-containing protein [Aneurinibacillus thermoaerophilus]MED0762759.1 copper amine oxidase N-terminal domain-containing protein [Aneurinibacillus thermoaerophilus]QYY44006.1 copper